MYSILVFIFFEIRRIWLNSCLWSKVMLGFIFWNILNTGLECQIWKKGSRCLWYKIHDTWEILTQNLPSLYEPMYFPIRFNGTLLAKYHATFSYLPWWCNWFANKAPIHLQMPSDDNVCRCFPIFFCQF